MCNSFVCARCGADLTKPYSWKGQNYGSECIKIVSGGSVKVKRNDQSVYVKIDSAIVENVAEGTARTKFRATVQGVNFSGIGYISTTGKEDYREKLINGVMPKHRSTGVTGWLRLVDSNGEMIWKNSKYDKETKVFTLFDDYGKVRNTIQL